MNLKQANSELEKLENEYEYWLSEKENLLKLVEPGGTLPKTDKAEGGTRVDKMLKFIELEDEKKINDTLDYIFNRQQSLLKWIKKELEIMLKYGEEEAAIIQLKETKRIKDKLTGKYRELTWEEISQEVHWSKTFCRNVYRQYKKQRFID